MKSVAHLTSAHRRSDTRILFRECTSLRKHGYDVTLIVNDDKGNETLPNGIRIVSTGFVPKGRLQRITEGVNRVYEEAVKADADIYHLHDPDLLRIALKLKGKGKKVIFDSHEIYGEQIRAKKYIPQILRGILSKGYLSYESHVCDEIDGVIDTNPVWEGKENFCGRSKRFVYVGNYPDGSEYKNVATIPYSERKHILYHGGLTEQRGITNLVMASKLAKTKVILAGRFSPDSYKERIVNNEYFNTVEYIGYVDKREEMFTICSQCAIGIGLLLPVGQYGRYKTFPTKVYEYMVSSMPVIISNFPYNEKMINKYHFGLVADPSDVEDIASKIRWLLDHPKEAEEMGKNGKLLLEEQFTWEVAEKELLRLYKEIENDKE